MKKLVKQRATAALAASGFPALVRLGMGRRLLVLTYHGVLRRPELSNLNRNCVSPEMLGRQLEYLRRHHTLVTLQEALEALRGREDLPRGSVLLTFDDGFRNNFAAALPILKAAGAPAVAFVTTGMLDEPGALPWVEELSARIFHCPPGRLELRSNGLEVSLELASPASRERASLTIRTYLKRAGSETRERMMGEIRRQCSLRADTLDPERFAFMNWEEARALAENAVEIGSHTVRHLCLSTLKDGELADEIGNSKRRIEEKVALPCIAFSYPDGTPESFGERERRALQDAGYQCAFSQVPGYNAPGSDLFALRRFNVPGGAADFPTFVATLAGLRVLARRLGF